MSRRALAGAVAAALTLAGCTATGPDPGPSTDPAPPSPSAPARTTPPEPPEPPALAWGPTEADLADAVATAAAMTPEQVAGQVLVARYAGADPATPGALVSELHLAGVILFAENVSSLDQVVATAAAVQTAQTGLGRDWPAVVSVDNEGGTVQRLDATAGPWTSFPSFASAGAAHDSDVVGAAARAMASELRASGITMDFAPVADVTVGPADVTIGTRSAGSDPALVGSAVVAALAGLAEGGVLAAVKHFPGHGSLTVDSHQGLPVQDATREALAAGDLVPFVRAIDAGSPMVMLGHIAVTAWDPGVPASLSPEAYRVLRQELGFTGVAVTDGLDMGALTRTRSTAQIAVDALAAGADLLLSPADVRGAHAGVVAALEDGTLPRARLDEAAGRVVAMMRWQAGLADAAGPVSTADIGSAGPASRALSDAAITVVSGACDGVLAGPTVHVRGGGTADWEAFVVAAERGGLDVVPLEQPADTTVRLLTDVTPSGSADVAIALDGPWALASTDAPTRLAAYGRTPQAMDAVVAVLTDAQGAPGRLPVTVDGLPASAC